MKRKVLEKQAYSQPSAIKITPIEMTTASHRRVFSKLEFTCLVNFNFHFFEESRVFQSWPIAGQD